MELYPILRASVETVVSLLGPSHSECTYQNAMEIELQERGLRYERQPPLPITYKGCCVGFHRPDLVVNGKVIVELKISKTDPSSAQLELWKSQLHRYLADAPKFTGLLVVFCPRDTLFFPSSPTQTVPLPPAVKKFRSEAEISNTSDTSDTLVISVPETATKFISFA